MFNYSKTTKLFSSVCLLFILLASSTVLPGVPQKAYAAAPRCRFTEVKPDGSTETFSVVSCALFVSNPDYNFDSSDFSNDKCYKLQGQAPTPSKSEVACDGPEFTAPAGTTAATSPVPTGATFDGDCKGSNITAGGTTPDTSCGILDYLVTGINILSGLVGLVVVIMIAVGGIQYSTARDNPQAVTAAKTRITNAIIALVASLFIYAFLQYIVPGGVL